MLFIVSNSAMANVDIVGINTIIIPLITPGMKAEGLLSERLAADWLPNLVQLQYNYDPSSANVL